jgi:sec-independent protein translocase protein TatB
MLSIPHMIVLFVLVLVVFGPQKLPELAKTLGKLMAEFRKASTDFKGAFEEEMRTIERQGIMKEREKAAAAAAASAQPGPATQGTAPGTEIQAENAVVSADGGTQATEALVIAPVVEAVPRAPEEYSSEKTESAAVGTQPQDAPHDQQPA